MLKLGEYNTLKVFRQTDNGIYLQDEEGNEVLLPNKFVPEELEQDQEMTVFIFTDGEDRYTATTQQPKLLANQFGYLEVGRCKRLRCISGYGTGEASVGPFFSAKTTDVCRGVVSSLYVCR